MFIWEMIIFCAFLALLIRVEVAVARDHRLQTVRGRFHSLKFRAKLKIGALLLLVHLPEATRPPPRSGLLREGTMIKLGTVSRLREDALRIVFPLAIIMSTTITWAGDVNNPANDSLLAMSAQRQADILGKIAGEGCKGKAAFYQGTMKDIPQPEGDRRPQLPVPPANENDTFWNVMCKNGRSYSIEVHPDGSNNVVECGTVKMFHLGECFKKF